MKKIELHVDGMTCHGCENRLKNTLSNIEGVTKVTANYQTKLVTITSKKDLDLSLITSKIIDLGFNVITKE